ncbi:hypothetical protein M6B38_384120 [Iris pallida]|uniref:CASP-like protein n=1 Tax=Iris pallida TaxID=29817 RepID=A0AAX6G473_IRIPA|nr:hypothetical protein M6B38_384120 [Iris pallida]
MGESGDMFGLQSIVRCSRLGIAFNLDRVRVLQLCVQIVFVCVSSAVVSTQCAFDAGLGAETLPSLGCKNSSEFGTMIAFLLFQISIWLYIILILYIFSSKLSSCYI